MSVLAQARRRTRGWRFLCAADLKPRLIAYNGFASSSRAAMTLPANQSAIEGNANSKAIILSALAIGLFWMALYLYVPTLSVYAKTKTSDLALVGVVVAQYGLWQAVIRLPLGIAADWLGRRKPFIIAGCALAVAGNWLMGASLDVNGLIIGRAISGLAAGAWVTMTITFSSLFPPAEVVRATAIITMVNSLCRMIATLATGPLNDLGGYSLSFKIAAAVAGLALVVFLLVKEQPRGRLAPSPRSLGRLFIRADVMLPSLVSAVGQYAAYAATYGFIPILAQQLGASNLVQSALTTLNLCVTMLGNLLASLFVKRTGTRALIYAGFGLLAVGLSLAALSTRVWMVFIATILNGLASGVVYPVCMGMSIEKVHGVERNTAMGLHQAVYAIGMFTGPWFSGMLADWIGIPAMFGTTAFLVLFLSWSGMRLLAASKPAANP